MFFAWGVTVGVTESSLFYSVALGRRVISMLTLLLILASVMYVVCDLFMM